MSDSQKSLKEQFQHIVEKYDARPDDFRFGAALGFYVYSGICFLKPRFIPAIIAHPNTAMVVSFVLGSAYLYSSRLYYTGKHIDSHYVSLITSSSATALALLNAFAKGRKIWYLFSIIPGLAAYRDIEMFQQANNQTILFQKEPLKVQKAHPARTSGPYPDMPDEPKNEDVVESKRDRI